MTTSHTLSGGRWTWTGDRWIPTYPSPTIRPVQPILYPNYPPIQWEVNLLDTELNRIEKLVNAIEALRESVSDVCEQDEWDRIMDYTSERCGIDRADLEAMLTTAE